jgi:hypothetical protein
MPAMQVIPQGELADPSQSVDAEQTPALNAGFHLSLLYETGV